MTSWAAWNRRRIAERAALGLCLICPARAPLGRMCRTCQDKANARQRATYLKRKNKGGALEKAAAILEQPTTLSSLAKQLGRPTRKGREIVDELRDRGWRFKRVMVRTGPWAVAYVTQTPGELK